MNDIVNRLYVQCGSDLHDDFVRALFSEAAVEIERLRRDAAPAQQDFPARFFANGPQGSAWFDDLSLATAMLAAFDKDDDWTITDTEEAPIPANDAYAYTREADRRISVLASLLNQANVDHLREVEALRLRAEAAENAMRTTASTHDGHTAIAKAIHIELGRVDAWPDAMPDEGRESRDPRLQKGLTND